MFQQHVSQDVPQPGLQDWLESHAPTGFGPRARTSAAGSSQRPCAAEAHPRCMAAASVLPAAAAAAAEVEDPRGCAGGVEAALAAARQLPAALSSALQAPTPPAAGRLAFAPWNCAKRRSTVLASDCGTPAMR